MIIPVRQQIYARGISILKATMKPQALRNACRLSFTYFSSTLFTSVVDPKLFIMDPDPTYKKVPVSDLNFFLTKYDFKGPKMAFQNITFKEYLNLVYKNGRGGRSANKFR
jgi:hypothetical protein